MGARRDTGTVATRMARAVRKAELGAETKLHEKVRKGEIEREKDSPPLDPGTGQTNLKRRLTPVVELVEKRKIGTEELQAATDISRAFNILAGRLFVRGMTFERIDRSGVDQHMGHDAEIIANYTSWANHWSKRSKAYCDPTLEIVVAAVIDERSPRIIGADLGFGHAKVELAIINGLRDYAARTGIVHGSLATRWMETAESLFVKQHPKLLDAVRRAKIER